MTPKIRGRTLRLHKHFISYTRTSDDLLLSVIVSRYCLCDVTLPNVQTTHFWIRPWRVFFLCTCKMYHDAADNRVLAWPQMMQLWWGWDWRDEGEDDGRGGWGVTDLKKQLRRQDFCWKLYKVTGLICGAEEDKTIIIRSTLRNKYNPCKLFYIYFIFI